MMSVRHIACVHCREKKIKCDGEQPTCQRCMRQRHHCVYMSAKMQDDTRTDLANYLDVLNERLSQAEARLGPQLTVENVTQQVPAPFYPLWSGDLHQQHDLVFEQSPSPARASSSDIAQNQTCPSGGFPDLAARSDPTVTSSESMATPSPLAPAHGHYPWVRGNTKGSDLLEWPLTLECSDGISLKAVSDIGSILTPHIKRFLSSIARSTTQRSNSASQNRSSAALLTPS